MSAPYVKTAAMVAIGAVVAMLLFAAAGYFIETGQLIRDPAVREKAGPLALGVFFLLFLVLGYALVPLFVRAFVVLQERIGNGELAIVRLLRDHARGITWGVWAMFTLGTVIALPVMLLDLGIVDLRSDGGRVEGALVANVDMPLAEMRKQSTLTLPEAVHVRSNGERMLIGDRPFDFRIAGTGMRFAHCRYFWIRTYPNDDLRIRSLSIGVSPMAMSRAGLVQAHATVQAQLRQDGWRAGRYRYDTPEEQALHGGMTSSGEGFLWLKGNTWLQLLGKRMDEEQPGEDPQTAGEWIQYLELQPASGSDLSAIDFER